MHDSSICLSFRDVWAFSDVQTADMLDLPGPISRGKGRSRSCVRCQKSKRALEQALVARYERIRSQKVDPREDNALAITTDGRKLALDALVSPPRPRIFPPPR